MLAASSAPGIAMVQLFAREPSLTILAVQGLHHGSSPSCEPRQAACSSNLMKSCPCLQVCRELSGEAVDYEEASGTGSDAEDALCVLLLVDTQTSQPDLDSIKEALLEVRLLSKSEQVHCLSQSLDGKAMTCTTTWLHKIRT